jgi:uncharacterized membrane protein
MNGEKYKTVCGYLGWTAIALVSIIVIMMFLFTILGVFLGLIGVAAIDGSDSGGTSQTQSQSVSQTRKNSDSWMGNDSTDQ